MNIAILGNSGSGKTYLAALLAKKLNLPAIELDEIFWLDSSFTKQRPEPEIATLAATADSHYGWIAEGIYGDMIVALLPQVGYLIWLDLPWETCKSRLQEREAKRESCPQQILELSQWAKNYPSRSDQFSRDYHQQIFNDYP